MLFLNIKDRKRNVVTKGIEEQKDFKGKDVERKYLKV